VRADSAGGQYPAGQRHVAERGQDVARRVGRQPHERQVVGQGVGRQDGAGGIDRGLIADPSVIGIDDKSARFGLRAEVGEIGIGDVEEQGHVGQTHGAAIVGVGRVVAGQQVQGLAPAQQGLLSVIA